MTKFTKHIQSTLKYLKTRQRKIYVLSLLIFTCGMLLAFGLRLAFVNRNAVHYHANFALFVDGQRDEFKDFTYYEEISACSVVSSNDPKTRAHLHDEINHVVHVHDSAVTWGAFFANLGYTLGDKVLVTNNGTYVNDADGKQLRFILNGQATNKISNVVIKSEDRLLIDYSADNNAVLRTRFNAVESDAHHYNITKDPNTCAGGKPETFIERVRRTIGINGDN